jgi:hypothetical protein
MKKKFSINSKEGRSKNRFPNFEYALNDFRLPGISKHSKSV